MLAQGCLLLNAALTTSSDGSVKAGEHGKFWKPVVERIVDEILSCKDRERREALVKGGGGGCGVVFGWWGGAAKKLRKMVDKLSGKYPSLPIKHMEHSNPAAQGDIFVDNDPFGTINTLLASVGLPEASPTTFFSYPCFFSALPSLDFASHPLTYLGGLAPQCGLGRQNKRRRKQGRDQGRKQGRKQVGRWW